MPERGFIMLVRMDVILKKAREEGYGVAAPNVFNMESVRSCFEAADELKAPLILDCSERFDLAVVADIVRYYERKYPQVVAALNLDHGKTFDAAVRAIRAGYTSVMVDRSTAPFEENIRETREIVKMAHAADVSCEAELGHVGMGVKYDEDRDKGLTRPEDAREYVERTSVDCLAVAIGTAHGRYVGTPKLDYDRLVSIKNAVQVPLVLHGGSSTGDDNLKRAVELGISKVNLFTDLSVAGARAAKAYLDGTEHPGMDFLSQEAGNGYKEMLKHYMILFGSQGKA